MQDTGTDRRFAQLRQMLLDAGLERYLEAFVQNDVDVDLLGDLTDDDFIALGVQSLGHRVKLRKLVRVVAASAPLPGTVAETGPHIFKRQ